MEKKTDIKKMKFDLSPKNGNNPILLLDAIKKGDSEMVHQLLENGAMVDCISTGELKKEHTPFHFAVLRGNKKIVGLFLTYGANANVQGKNNVTPLHIAAKKGYTLIAENLLNRGACIHSVTLNEGYTPMHFAAEIGCLHIVKLLLNKGADVNFQSTKDNLTPLHIASQRGYASENSFKKIVKTLLKYNADVNLGDRNGNTPLHISAKSGNEAVTEMLIKKGANVNAVNKNGTTILQNAIQSSPESVAKLLMECGAKIDYKSIPLHLIAKLYDKEIVETSLKSGAEINSTDDEGRTALYIAVECGHTEMVEILLEYNADVNLGDREGSTPLHISAITGNEKATEMLIKKGANVNSKTTGFRIYGTKIKCNSSVGMTPLHLSAKKGYKKCVETLLKLGADINSKESRGRTPLHIATLFWQKEVIICLLEHGANVNDTCQKNCTPLEYEYEKKRFYVSGQTFVIPFDPPYDYVLVSNNYLRGTYGCDFLAYPPGTYGCDFENKSIPYSDSEIILPHVIKMEAANLYLSENNLFLKNQSRRSDKFKYFQNECQREVVRMKCEKISNTNVSFYDILTKDAISLAKFMRNENILEVLKAEEFKTKFPIYARMIICQFKKGITANELIERANKNFRILFHKLPQLPYVCTDRIFNYLSNKDLRNFIDACKFGDKAA